MDKPISVVIEEVEKNLIDTINTSNLPAFVIESILYKLFNEAQIAKKRQYDMDLKKYQESIHQESIKQIKSADNDNFNKK